MNLGYSQYENNPVPYIMPEFGLIIREGNFGKLNILYQNIISDHKFKIEDKLKIDQILFLKNNLSLNISFSKYNTDVEESSKELSLGLNYNF